MKYTALAITLLCAAQLFATDKPQWIATPKSDALTGKSYITYTLAGKFLTPPSRHSDDLIISLRCDPTAKQY
jgi:hypothetical protein